jgi:peptidoglycan-associated lipoprotein
MKHANWLSLLVVGLAVTLAATGCKKGRKNITPIPGPTTRLDVDSGMLPPVDSQRPGEGPGAGLGQAIPGGPPPVVEPIPDTGKELASLELIQGMIADRERFRADTVYFDFDRATIKASERSKLEDVANHLRANPPTKVQIEGHCDERGTEEYNRALGERRALAAREYLITLGIASDRVFTISYGEDRPAVQGTGEAVWSKNRRAEFILLLPKPPQ